MFWISNSCSKLYLKNFFLSNTKSLKKLKSARVKNLKDREGKKLSLCLIFFGDWKLRGFFNSSTLLIDREGFDSNWFTQTLDKICLALPFGESLTLKSHNNFIKSRNYQLKAEKNGEFSPSLEMKNIFYFLKGRHCSFFFESNFSLWGWI